MVTRQERLNGFTFQGNPPDRAQMEVLCEDNSGTYALPFACHWADGSWINSAAGVPIECRVIGWRSWS